MQDVEALLPLVYARLRRVAGAYMRGERRGHSLSPTEVVHEAYMRLARGKKVTLAGRSHFCALAAREMRRVLREYAQRHDAQRRGGGLTRVSLPPDLAAPGQLLVDILAVEAFLDQTRKRSPRRAEVLELRLFGGLTEEEIAEVLGVTSRTVRADLAAGRARLAQFLRRGGHDEN